MLVRKAPLASPGRTDAKCASDAFTPGTNIPFVPPPAAGEKSRLVTRRSSPELVNSTAPAVDGVLNADWIMSSKARDSRGPTVNCTCGAAAGQGPRKQRYTAVTPTGAVYEVLNTRTSEKNGLAAEPTGSEVTAGTVSVSARAPTEKRSTRAESADSCRRAARVFMMFSSEMLQLTRSVPRMVVG